MPRYIDADELKRLSIKFGEEQGKQRFSELLCEYIDCIPTADVVPKSEIEKLNNKLIIWKQDRFNLYQRLELYEMARQKVAREIFEELKQKKKELWNSGKYTMFECWCKAEDEVKKKYIGESDVKRDTV